MPITIPVAMLIAQGVSTGAQMYSTSRANRANERAFQSQQDAEKYALDEQLRLERERAAEERRRYDLEQQEKAAERERQKPFENMRLAALAAMAKMNGVDLPPELFASMATGGRGQQTDKPISGDFGGNRPMSMADAVAQAQQPGMASHPVSAPMTGAPMQTSTRQRPASTMAIQPFNADSFLARVQQAQAMRDKQQALTRPTSAVNFQDPYYGYFGAGGQA